VNGRRVRLHSMTFASTLAPSLQQRLQQLIDTPRPASGDWVIELPLAPEYINVLLEDEDIENWPAELSLSRDHVVVHVGSANNRETVEVAKRFGYGNVDVTCHRVTLGFSITFHKVQGQTLDRIIIDLNDVPYRLKVDYHGLYVALSRVRRSAHVRLMPMQLDSLSLMHLTKLQPSHDLRVWLAGFGAGDSLWRTPAVVPQVPGVCFMKNRHALKRARVQTASV
jgi:hypothetical protein